MTKKELIERIVDHSGADKATVLTILNSISHVITQGLIQEEKITFGELGIFKTAIKKSRVAKNPRTGELVEVAQKRSVKFTPTKKLKEIIDF
ncbi:DNA-binding protein HU-beta [Mycoplasma testudineum]|uniref:DNA-binding protein HU-beta n=1 Tax=Mycoplasma testudineum TaxID=244584 RepID=A0A4R6ICS7_9MOLU|nr:HU family DNA-binding protein [Mycoplasma testudineum]OYD26578.1 DNA-binding protein [Mycoplasma testudineum]TDO19411.1 DNA-binding protein HU-beta [Mycoplasma testudineum]